MSLKDKILLSGAKLLGLMAQQQDHHNPVKTVTPGMPELLREAAAAGAVLLENRALPFARGTRLSVFGRTQLDYFYTGYGSGGDVNYPYAVSLLEGLRNCEDLRVNESLAKIYENWVSQHPADHGVWGHYHYDLVKTILRDEWGYEGNVMTDWWMQYTASPEFPELMGNAYRVRARVDVLMPGGRSPTDKKEKPDHTLLATYGKANGITLGELQEAARNVLRCVMELKQL